MQDLKFQGNEVAVSMAANAFEGVLEGNNMALFVSGALGVGKTSLMSRLRVRLSSPRMLERFSTLAGRTLEDGFVDFVDYDAKTGHVEAHDGYAVIFVDDVEDKDDGQLDKLRSFVRTMLSSQIHFMLVMAYTNSGVKNKSAMLLPVMSEIRGTLISSGVGTVDIEVKPMTLADIAIMVMDTLSPNNFESNFVNKLRTMTGGVQLFITEAIRYMRELGVLRQDGDGVWTLDNAGLLDSRINIGTLEAKRIELLSTVTDFSADGVEERFVQLCDNYTRHHIVGEKAADLLAEIATRIASDNSLPKKLVQTAADLLALRDKSASTTADAPGHHSSLLIINDLNIGDAAELLEDLSKQYKMPQVLENAQYMLDVLDKSDLEGRMTALQYKTDALIFLGMYHEAYATAEEMMNIANTDPKFGKWLHAAYFRLGHSAGLYQDFETSDKYMYKAAEMADSDGDRRAAASYRSTHIFLMADHHDYMEGLLLMKAADKIASEIGDVKTLAECSLGAALLRKSIYSKEFGMAELETGMKFAEKSGDHRLIARAHSIAGMCYQTFHDRENALEHLTKAETMMMQIGDNPGLAGVRINLGYLMNDWGNYDAAIRYFQDSLSISRSIGLYVKMLPAYVGLGSANIYRGNQSAADTYYKEVMAVAKKIGNLNALGYAFSSLGEYQQQSGNYEEAFSYYRTALEYDRKNNDVANIFYDLINMASMCGYINKIDEGIDYIHQAKTAAVGGLWESMRGTVNNIMAGFHIAKEEYKKALQYYKFGLEGDLDNNDLVNASISYGNLCGVYQTLDDYKNAEKMMDKAMEIDRKLDDQFQLANHLGRQGINYQAQGRFQESRDMFIESAGIYRKMNLLEDAAQMLRNAAVSMHDLDEDNAAEKTLNEALATVEETGNYAMQPDIIRLLALSAYDNSRIDEAVSLYKKAADMYAEHDLEYDEVFSDIMLAWAEMYIENEKYEEAIGCYDRLANVYKEKDTDSYVQNKILSGKVYMSIPDEDGASDTFDEVLSLFPSMKDHDKKCAAMSDYGDFLCWIQRTDEGLEYKTRAAEEMRGSDNRELLAQLYYSLAERLQERRQYEWAIENYNFAMKVYRGMNDKYHEGLVANNIGYIYDVMCKVRTAAQYYYAAYQCYKEADDLDGMYNNITNAALMFEKISEIGEAAKCYKIAFDMLSFPDADPQERGNAAFSLAKCLNDDTHDFLTYINIAYAKFRDAGSLMDMLATIDALSLHYWENNRRHSFKSGINVARSLLRTYKSYDAQVNIYNAIAVLYTYAEDVETAIEYFYKSIMILAERDMWIEMAHEYFFMATKLIRDDDKLALPITVKGKTYRLCDYCIECLGFAIKTAEKEDDLPLLADSLGTRSLLYWNDKKYDLFEADMEAAIQKSPTDEGRVSLMLHRGILYMLGKEYDKAKDQFLKTSADAKVNGLYDENVMANGWLCYLSFETENMVAANYYFHLLEQDLEFALTHVPGLNTYIHKKKL